MALKPCAECGREVSTSANTCPNCGMPNPTEQSKDTAQQKSPIHWNLEIDDYSASEDKKWYDRTWLVILWLILFFPVGLFALYKNQRLSRNSKYVVIGLFLILGVVAVTIDTTSVEEERFVENRSEIISDLEDQLSAGNYSAVVDTARLYLQHVQDSTLLSIRNQALEDSLVAQAAGISSEDIEQKRDIYLALTEINEDEDEYWEQLRHYEGEIAERRRIQRRLGDAWVMCQQYVENRLRSPSTASFPWGYSNYMSYQGDDRYRAVSYVDAENAFGAEIRTYFDCTVEYRGESNWSLITLEMD